MPLLIQFGKNLQHLEIKRKLSYKSLTGGKMAWERVGKFSKSDQKNPFKWLK